LIIEVFSLVGRKWSKEEIEKLIEMYPNHSAFEIAQVLNRTLESVQVKADRLGLRKSHEYFVKKGKEKGKRSALLRGDKVWSELELEKLKKLYPVTPTKELAKIFGCTIDAIRGQAWLLKLRKNKKILGRTQFERAHKIGVEGEAIAEDFFRRNGWKIIERERNLGHKFGVTPFDFIVKTDKGEEYAINVKHGKYMHLKEETVNNLQRLTYRAAVLYITSDKRFFFMPIIPLSEAQQQDKALASY
jgi:Holliday junction resolvase-like predicted endonuclease